MSQAVIRENLIMAKGPLGTPLTPLGQRPGGMGALNSPLRPNSSPLTGGIGILHSINNSGSGVPPFSSNSPS